MQRTIHGRRLNVGLLLCMKLLLVHLLLVQRRIDVLWGSMGIMVNPVVIALVERSEFSGIHGGWLFAQGGQQPSTLE